MGEPPILKAIPFMDAPISEPLSAVVGLFWSSDVSGLSTGPGPVAEKHCCWVRGSEGSTCHRKDSVSIGVGTLCCSGVMIVDSSCCDGVVVPYHGFC